MKCVVRLSAWCWFITIVLIGVGIAVPVMLYYKGHIGGAWIWIGAYCIMAISALFYAPLSISADDEKLYIETCLRKKSIPLRDIAHVRLCPPTMGESRILGSGGFCGYWGWFRERDLGKYFAYYGKASDCFLIVLRGGRKYMLGCTDPGSLVNYIAERIPMH